MSTSLQEFIHALPKCELHVHLEGCLTPDLAKTLAQRNNIPLPDSITKSSLTSGYAFHDLTSFLAVYYPAMTVLITQSDFTDLAYTYLLKAHSQNVRRAEMFFDPQAHTSRGVAFHTVLDGYWAACERAHSELGMSVGLIMCFLRDMSVDSAKETVEEALKPGNRERIIGVGLDSDERGNPPEKFAEVFKRAREGAKDVPWKVTVHCDVDQVGSVKNIREAVVNMNVDRVDHGTNVVEDEALIEILRDRGIGLTCCPMSNAVVTPDFKGKEMVRLLRDGVKVTINSDDPAYFRGYVEENLVMIAERMELGVGEVVKLARNAFEICWAEEREKAGWFAELDELEKKERE